MKTKNIIYLVSGLTTVAILATVAINDSRLKAYNKALDLANSDTLTPPTIPANYSGKKAFLTWKQQEKLTNIAIIPSALIAIVATYDFVLK
jgi:hypothetical protein